jgi:ubiquinone/menaquinone biosynthesis C-methylase UbiE
MEFKDHFSRQSDIYAQARPTYPDALFDFLCSMAPGQGLCWDCATGNGQAAFSLARYFKQVVATDASQKQIENAKPAGNISYRVALAEASGLPDHCADIITVAQAAHWFKLDEFYKEAARVARKDAILALWTYSEARINAAIDPLMEWFEYGYLLDYWPDQRWYVRNKYETLPFPFKPLNTPALFCTANWTKAQWLNYVKSWSAYNSFIVKNGTDPLQVLLPQLDKLWNDTEQKAISWPLHLKCTRLI